MSNRAAQWKYRCALHNLTLRTVGFNDCLGVMKSIMGELTDSTNRAQGFSLLPAVWCFGATIGSVAKQFYVLVFFLTD